MTEDAGVPEWTLEGSGEDVTDEELRLARSGEKRVYQRKSGC